MTWVLSAFADEAGGSTDEQIAALQRAGFSHIDPRMVDGHNICDLPLDLAEQVKAKYDAAGVAVGMYGSPIGKIDIADDCEIDFKKLEHLGKLKGIFGAGGGRMWLEETIGKRINQERAEEMVAQGVDTVAVSCPFCLTMIEDGMKELEKDESVKTRDIAELVAEYMK